jgi:DNA-binding NtrC family response regulator
LHHFLSYFAAENGFEEPFLEQDAINILLNYGWPGNVRELRNFCENLVVLKRGSNITQYDLDPRFTLTSNKSAQELDNISSPTLSVEENEKRLLRNALLQARGNKTKAAELMGISRRTLHRKLVRWPELDID